MNKLASFARDYSFASFFIPFGVILVIVGLIFGNTITKRSEFPEIDSVVTRAELEEEAYSDGENSHEATYRIYVSYTVDGKEYEEELGVMSEIKPGTHVKINYDPANPADISQATKMIVPIIMIIAGAVAFVAGIVSIFVTSKKRKALKQQEEEWNHG